MSVYLWGPLLFLAVLVGLFLGIRLNYQKNIQKSEFCPKCGGNKFHRVHRHSADRIFGFGLQSRRFRCANPNCNWEGIRQYHPHSKNWKKSKRRSEHRSGRHPEYEN
jgi:hypothetical protein